MSTEGLVPCGFLLVGLFFVSESPRWLNACLVLFGHCDLKVNFLALVLVDAYQYNRIYSPATFGKKYDPNGNYIRHFLPILKDMPREYIYEPWTAPLSVQTKAKCIVGKDYPKHVVFHDSASKECKSKMGEAYELNRRLSGQLLSQNFNFPRQTKITLCISKPPEETELFHHQRSSAGPPSTTTDLVSDDDRSVAANFWSIKSDCGSTLDDDQRHADAAEALASAANFPPASDDNEFDGMLLDYSQQRTTAETLGKLQKLAEAAHLTVKITRMFNGDKLCENQGMVLSIVKGEMLSMMFGKSWIRSETFMTKFEVVHGLEPQETAEGCYRYWYWWQLFGFSGHGFCQRTPTMIYYWHPHVLLFCSAALVFGFHLKQSRVCDASETQEEPVLLHYLSQLKCLLAAAIVYLLIC
ncbi:hypothetical protein ACFE04_019512 [Oxalis oulophora]